MAIDVNDKVQHVSGGPEMRVEAVLEDDRVEVFWMEGKQPCSLVYPKSELRVVINPDGDDFDD